MLASLLARGACLRGAGRVAVRGSAFAVAPTKSLLPLRATRGIISSPSSPSSDAAATARPVDALLTLQAKEEDVAVADKKQKERLMRIVKKHLAHMEDPWKIAQHVEQTLAKDRFDEALLLTQQASRDRQVVVSWNHLIAHQLQKQQLKMAIKLFNDVCPSPEPAPPLTRPQRRRGSLRAPD